MYRITVLIMIVTKINREFDLFKEFLARVQARV